MVTRFSHKMTQKPLSGRVLEGGTVSCYATLQMERNMQKRFDNVSGSKTFQHIVRAFQLDAKSVLDIGCSFGEFLAHFGPGSVGISISTTEIASGKENALDIRLGNVEDKTFQLQETFDVIFANNIFEHLYSPHAFLVKIKPMLKPGGILILGVPCIPKIVSLTNIRKFRGAFAEQHINFFTRDTLINTAIRAGWTPSQTRGFRFANRFVDALLDPIYPHFYLVATPTEGFAYTDKRMRELAGYTTNTQK